MYSILGFIKKAKNQLRGIGLSMLRQLIFFLWMFSLCADETLERAHEVGVKALQAHTWQEQFASLNAALGLYQVAENKLGGNPDLNLARADLFFELQEYAWSILYYERVLAESPQNHQARDRLNQAQKKLGLPLASISASSYVDFLLLKPFLAQAAKAQLFVGLAILALFLAAMAILKPVRWIKMGAYSIASLSLYVALNYLLVFYVSPIEAIVITSVGLYREPGGEQQQLIAGPLMEGAKLRVIDTAQEGNWLKVIDTEGVLGYVPAASARII